SLPTSSGSGPALTPRASGRRCCRVAASSSAAWRRPRLRSSMQSTAAGGSRAARSSACPRLLCARARTTSGAFVTFPLPSFAGQMFNLIPKEVRFFDFFEQQSQHILRAAALLHEMVHNFGDARAKAHAIKEVEHQGDHTTHEIIKKLNTT